MQMRHGDDDERFSVRAEDQTIREARQQTTTQARLDFGARQRERRRAADRPVDFIEEVPPQPCPLFVVPGDRVIELLPGHGKETDSHARRCLAMTVS